LPRQLLAHRVRVVEIELARQLDDDSSFDVDHAFDRRLLEPVQCVATRHQPAPVLASGPLRRVFRGGETFA
jgi:hypothetical protein